MDNHISRTVSIVILFALFVVVTVLLFISSSSRAFLSTELKSTQDRLDQCQLKVWEYENAEDDDSTSACLRLKDEADFYRDAYYSLKDQDGYRLWAIAQEQVRKWEQCFPDEFCNVCLDLSGGDIELCYDISLKVRTDFP